VAFDLFNWSGNAAAQRMRVNAITFGQLMPG
jgi:hypothetical protein